MFQLVNPSFKASAYGNKHCCRGSDASKWAAALLLDKARMAGYSYPRHWLGASQLGAAMTSLLDMALADSGDPTLTQGLSLGQLWPADPRQGPG